MYVQTGEYQYSYTYVYNKIYSYRNLVPVYVISLKVYRFHGYEKNHTFLKANAHNCAMSTVVEWHNTNLMIDG